MNLLHPHLLLLYLPEYMLNSHKNQQLRPWNRLLQHSLWQYLLECKHCSHMNLLHPHLLLQYWPEYMLNWHMILIFLHVFFAPFKRIKRCLDTNDIPGAAAQLNQIRMLVGTNTLLGVLTIITATAGKYYLN